MFLRLTLLLAIASVMIGCTPDELTPKRETNYFINGTVLGFDGKPMEMAHVNAKFFGKKFLSTSVQADKKGEFSIPSFPADLINLVFTGVNHKRYFFSIYNSAEKEDIELHVKLEPNVLLKDLSNIKVIGNFNNYSFSKGGIPMKMIDNRTFSAQVPNKKDTLFYQILGAVNERSVNGTMNEGFIYDGDGDYRSFVLSKDTLVEIIFDPLKMKFPESKPVISSKNERIKHYISVKEKSAVISEEALGIYRQTNDIKKYFQYVYENNSKLLSKEKDPRTKMMLTSNIIYTADNIQAKPDKRLIKDFLSKIGSKSFYWDEISYILIPAVNLINEKSFTENFIDDIINNHPSVNVRQKILYDFISSYHAKGNKKEEKKYYNLLIKKHADSPLAKMAKKEFSPDKKIVVNKIVPDFTIENYDKPGSTISSKELRGKYVLIDMWASWCGPCVGEMENLHKAFEKFKNKNFIILSISIDKKKEDIAKFRSGKWKMPWLHSFSEGVWKSKMVEFFEVTGVPKPMLIGPDGKILEMEGGLRGQELEMTLKKYL